MHPQPISKPLWLLLATCLVASNAWAQTHPTMKVRELPDALKQQWQQTKPEMNENSHCAAAFNNQTDYEKMTFKCSIYIRLSAEGARRAMRYCEEDREKKHIHGPCKLVEE